MRWCKNEFRAKIFYQGKDHTWVFSIQITKVLIYGTVELITLTHPFTWRVEFKDNYGIIIPFDLKNEITENEKRHPSCCLLALKFDFCF